MVLSAVAEERSLTLVASSVFETLLSHSHQRRIRMLATALLRQSLLRPAMVTEYGKNTASNEAYRWRLFQIATWVITAGCGLTMAFVEEYPGSSRTGRHVFSGVRAR